jgi:hypothetical protein
LEVVVVDMVDHHLDQLVEILVDLAVEVDLVEIQELHRGEDLHKEMLLMPQIQI